MSVSNVLKKNALKSVNLSKEGHIKSVKTAQSSNWIFCSRPARSRFSLHGAPKTLQALQKSCEPFSSLFYAAFYSPTSLAGSNKAKGDERFEVKTFSEKQNKKKPGANCVGAWEWRESGRSAHNKPVVNLAVKVCLKKTANCCMKCIQV